MYFREDIEPCCSYCRNGQRISDTEVICLRKGVVPAGGYCGKFRYDALKREPSAPITLKTGRFTDKDFEL